MKIKTAVYCCSLKIRFLSDFEYTLYSKAEENKIFDTTGMKRNEFNASEIIPKLIIKNET
jgi:hypothetical protein